MKDEVLAAVQSVLESQHFIMGPEVEKLESEVAKFIGCTFAMGCASGSDALLLALMSAGVDSGDEVITTPFTFVATAGSIARLKAKPVFVDIDTHTYNLDCKQLEAAFTRNTKAIIPVHLFGLPAEMASVMDIARAHNVAVIEDAAQAIGSRYHDEYVGNIGSCACFSFFPSKNLGGAGDGGMITTNDPEFADRVSVLAQSRQSREISLRSAGHEQPPGCAASRDPTGEVQPAGSIDRGSPAKCQALPQSCLSDAGLDQDDRTANRARRSIPRVPPVRDPYSAAGRTARPPA